MPTIRVKVGLDEFVVLSNRGVTQGELSLYTTGLACCNAVIVRTQDDAYLAHIVDFNTSDPNFRPNPHEYLDVLRQSLAHFEGKDVKGAKIVKGNSSVPATVNSLRAALQQLFPRVDVTEDDTQSGAQVTCLFEEGFPNEWDANPFASDNLLNALDYNSVSVKTFTDMAPYPLISDGVFPHPRAGPARMLME
mmetsp:Transcript_125221/g.196218  ORF Transcript_125221/g.196218 Transcript_125221/m.196218 type:complete len:192 (-) Transcript_125221:75-650(-)